MSSTQSLYEIYLDEQKSILANKNIDLAEKIEWVEKFPAKDWGVIFSRSSGGS